MILGGIFLCGRSRFLSIIADDRWIARQTRPPSTEIERNGRRRVSREPVMCIHFAPHRRLDDEWPQHPQKEARQAGWHHVVGDLAARCRKSVRLAGRARPQSRLQVWTWMFVFFFRR